MPNTHSKPVTPDTAVIKRSYEEPIPFVPQVDKTNVQKPRDIKIPLRQDPANARSAKVEKVFSEFVENSPEAFCRWRCDTEEYIRGAAITAPAGQIQAGAQLLGQHHKTTWETIISTVVPAGPVTTDAEVVQIFEAFALNFMDSTARRKQKRYMTSGSIQKPKGWSSRQVASRLSTLNRYLQYLPGTAAAFADEEMKDMLVDIHSPVYQHLLARANYNVDNNTYLQLTMYLQNLSLIEESFSKGQVKSQGNGEGRPVHKAGKSFSKNKSKLGKLQCRKHPHHEHTWADCWGNPKNKNKKPFKKTAEKKAEAHAMEVEEEETEMDQALEVLHLEDEEVRTLKQWENNNYSPDNTNQAYPHNITTSTVTALRVGTSNKKKRLVNKNKITHHCNMQTPLSRKMRHIDDTNPADLVTELTALIKNNSGLLPNKLHRVYLSTLGVVKLS